MVSAGDGVSRLRRRSVNKVQAAATAAKAGERRDVRGSARNEENWLAPQYHKILYLNVLSPNSYIAKLFRLKRANGAAPHKPALVLTLLELIDKENSNRFTPDIDLVGIFQENWRLVVATAHRADFTQPYYYLQSDKVSGESIWQLVTYPAQK